jgi:transposase
MGEEANMRITLFPLDAKAVAELDKVYRTAKDGRVRIRALMVLLSGEKGMTADEIAEIVRREVQAVRRWLKRYLAEGINGLYDALRSGTPNKVTPAYQEQLITSVRQRPRSLGQPYSMWTLQRLADYMAEQTGIRVTAESVRQHLKEADIVLSRPQHKVSSPDPEYEVKKRRSKRPETT